MAQTKFKKNKKFSNIFTKGHLNLTMSKNFNFKMYFDKRK